MENVYIIFDGSSWVEKIVLGLNISPSNIINFQEHVEDWQTDRWVTNEVTQNISCLIVPIELGENRYNSVQGLRIAMHIRLTNSPIKYLPMVFVSNREDWQIRQMLRDNLDKNHLDYIIGTKGTDLLKPHLDEIIAVIANINPLKEEEYKRHFYDHIHLLQLEQDGGKHSLANIWGALRLNEVLNLNAIQDKNLINRTKELYFKYLRAFHTKEENQTGSKNEEIKLVNCQNKRILLIDDEADKGWKNVLSAIFKDTGNGFDVFSDFLVIDKGIEVATEKVTKEDWDLILLDLRLNPSEEDTGDKLIKTEEYSGAKILKAIKEHNAGIQVIMLTASNKAWNMKKLLDLGADGYYIKESPEFNFSPTYTLDSYNNFVDECNLCFERNFLRQLFIINQAIGKRLNQESFPYRYEHISKNTVSFIKIYLAQAFNSISKYRQTEKEYVLYSFLDYYKIVEVLCKDMIDYNSEKYFIWKKRNSRSKIDFILKSPLVSKIKPIKRNDDSVETYQKSDYNPNEIDDKYYKGYLSSSLQFSGLLLLRFDFDENTVKDFMKLNNLRNNVAHSSENVQDITPEDVICIAKLLERVFQNL